MLIPCTDRTIHFASELLQVCTACAILQIDFLQANISQLESRAVSLWADVVVMNPPFGTRRKGADLEFLRAAFQVNQSDINCSQMR